MKSKHDQIRKLLHESEDGLTADQIAVLLQAPSRHSIGPALRAMPDAYIDRWTGPVKGQYTAVWFAAVIPEDCPKPQSRE